MRFLDTREQKSPRFLIKEFPELVECEHIRALQGCAKAEVNCPFLGDWVEAGKYCKQYVAKGIKPLNGQEGRPPVGDYFSGENKTVVQVGVEEYKVLMGNLVEIKIGKDIEKHTEPLERVRDEGYRTCIWQEKNPHVQTHLVCMGRYTDHEKRIIYHYGQTYYDWTHIVETEKEMIAIFKRLDQNYYKKHVPYLKRSHEEPTILAKMLRQFPGISSEKAIAIAELCSCKTITSVEDDWIIETIGRKKDGTPKKLALKLIKWLETGESP